MNEPLVSIIIPVYKGEKYLEECVESVFAQTYAIDTHEKASCDLEETVK